MFAWALQVFDVAVQADLTLGFSLQLLNSEEKADKLWFCANIKLDTKAPRKIGALCKHINEQGLTDQFFSPANAAPKWSEEPA